jgi:hypothetical protein
MRIHVGDRLGSINNQAHVHLAVGTGGFETNAVALGFQGYADHFAPRITDVALLDDNDQPMAAGGDGVVMVARQGRGVQIVVEAWDQVDNNLPRRRLGMYQVGYQILDAAGQRCRATSSRAGTSCSTACRRRRKRCGGLRPRQRHHRAWQRGDPVPLPGHQHRA